MFGRRKPVHLELSPSAYREVLTKLTEAGADFCVEGGAIRLSNVSILLSDELPELPSHPMHRPIAPARR